VLQAPREWGGGGDIPLPTGGRVWEGPVPTAQKIFRIFC